VAIESTVQQIVAAWESSSHTLDYLLEGAFRQSNLTSAEKAQVTEQTCNWARGRGTAIYWLTQTLTKGPQSLPPPLRRKLEVTACRILFEERTPKPIIASRTVEEVKSEYGTRLAGLTNAVLRRLIADPPAWPDRKTDPVAYLAAVTSHPEWILKRWLARWEFDRVLAQAHWDNLRPALWLRWNRMRGDLDKAREVITSNELKVLAAPAFEGFFKLESPFYPIAARLVASGDFQVQDPSASLAVRLLSPKADQEIVDLCAAPGGKTTLMAQMAESPARITAVDLSAPRLATLQRTLSSLGLTGLKTVAQDARSFAEDAANQSRFDAVLLDVPCSGFGVLGRRADLRWRRQPQDMVDLIALQRELIRAASSCVKPGGILVYSTCSIEGEENQEIVHEFLAEYNNFQPDAVPAGFPTEFIIAPGEIATYSPRDQIDGAYAARLIRTH
jgi:16S rRNA (cytosine967-C5)-methyltransferase